MAVRNTNALKRKLGDILVEVGIINRDQLQEALKVQRQKGGKLGAILMELGYVSEDVLLAFLGRQCGVSYVSLEEYGDIPASVIKLVPESVVRHQSLIPISREENVITIAMSDPLNVFATDDLKLLTGCEVRVVIASKGEILGAIKKYYSGTADGGISSDQPSAEPAHDPSSMDDILQGMEHLSAGAEDIITQAKEEKEEDTSNLTSAAGAAPVIKMVNLLIANAVKIKASDIHIEPFEKKMRIRYRLDGVLQEQSSPPRKFLNPIVSRIKIISQLNIAEKRLPQDGRVKVLLEGREIALRVSTIPTPHGEKVVMRILDSSGVLMNLDQLGFEPEVMKRYQSLIELPHGIILVTGPTGSGKTTTLYSTISAINKPDVNIVTIEDPIEYPLPGINQVHARPEIGLTFASGLRAFLRQDPDIIFVGEVRDNETASIAVNAALTGHLVFSTLHTNDASGAVTRLRNMGVEAFLTASTLNAVLAQRLLRTLCPQCKGIEEVDREELMKLGVQPDQAQGLFTPGVGYRLPKAKGCENCSNTGYRGRIAVHELLPVTKEIREFILDKSSDTQIKNLARKQGMKTLRESAILHLIRGKTSIEEVIRVTQTDDAPEA